MSQLSNTRPYFYHFFAQYLNVFYFSFLFFKFLPGNIYPFNFLLSNHFLKVISIHFLYSQQVCIINIIITIIILYHILLKCPLSFFIVFKIKPEIFQNLSCCLPFQFCFVNLILCPQPSTSPHTKILCFSDFFYFQDESHDS